MKTADARALAAQVLQQVIYDKRSLTPVLSAAFTAASDLQEKSLVQELCYGVLRWYYPLIFIVNQLVDKPLRAKDEDVQTLLLVGLYQLIYLRVPDYAAVSATVNAATALKKNWAAKLINGVLRQYLRRQADFAEQISQNPCLQYSHPKWLVKALRTAWPEHWQTLLTANNTHPPFALRVNTLKNSREDYLQLLAEPFAQTIAYTQQGITLPPRNVTTITGFANGWVSVQDGAAQLAAELLKLAPKQRVLDACAAPGGKTTHILELAAELDELVAIDNDDTRLQRVRSNLQRLALNAKLICADAADTAHWWDGKLFDRILVDAPCSATGVIRRHPDIKLLKKWEDCQQLAEQQTNLLEKLWPLLKQGGILLYCTCSLLPIENANVITAFLAQHPEAKEDVIEADWGIAAKPGRQILPGMMDSDGFYYARLVKLG